MTEHHKLAVGGSRHDHHHHHHADDDDHEMEIEITKPYTIFDACHLAEPVPKGFDAVKIAIDGRVAADLAWNQARSVAEAYISQGFKIFWEIDLGLFKALRHPLDHKSQFLSLSLSLQHFRDTLWKDFRKDSIGLCLYRGNADFSSGYMWNEVQHNNLTAWLKDLFKDIYTFQSETGLTAESFEGLAWDRIAKNDKGLDLLRLFCRDAAGEYLCLLAATLPDTIPCFALLDASSIQSPSLVAQLVTKERYPNICLGVKGFEGLVGDFGWECSGLKLGGIYQHVPKEISSLPNIGICFPPMSVCLSSKFEKLEVAMKSLLAKQTPFRIIPETLLTTEWDGLDYLVVDRTVVSVQGKRKLQGFIAAGGTILEG